MTRTRLIAALAAFTILAGVPMVGGAQTPASSADAPVAWGGDDLEITSTGFSLIGRAEFTQGENRLRAERVNMVFSEGADRDLEQVEAVGEVYFVTPTQTMRGDRAVYDLSSEELVVTGEVILSEGDNVARGGRLVYNVRTGTGRMEGAPTAAGRRVQGVFYPED